MTPGFKTRRRAERFAGALESPRDVAPLGVDPEWLHLVARLEAVPTPRPRPEFAAALREQLVSAARVELAAAAHGTAPDPLERLRLGPSGPRTQRRVSVAVAGLALVGATGGVAVASQGALPGETLYPLKRAIEDIRTGLEADSAQRGTALIGQARDRLTEVAALTADDDADPRVVDQTLDAFTEQAGVAAASKLDAYAETGRESEVLEVRAFATDAAGVLGSLEPVVPEESRPALLRAADAVRDLDTAARQACAGCGGPVVDLAPALALDPVSGDGSHVLGVPGLSAHSWPDGERGGRGEDRAGRTDRGSADGDRERRAERGDGTRDASSGDGARSGARSGGGGGSLPGGGGSAPDDPLRGLRDDVGGTLEGLGDGVTGDGSLDDPADGGLGTGGTGGRGGTGGTSDTGGTGESGSPDGRESGSGAGGAGGGPGGRTGSGPVDDTLDQVDQPLGGLLP